MKVNLIVDTNNLFYQNADVKYYANRVGHKFPTTEKKLGSPEALEIFKESINVSFRTICQNFSKIDQVYFVQDSSSWRKQVDIHGEKSYKANREDSHDDMDWNAWTTGIDWMISSEPHYTNIRMKGFEADDLVCLLNRRLLEEDPTCVNIILSSDGDFQQLLQPRTLIYHPVRNHIKLLMSEDFTLEDIKILEEKEPAILEAATETSNDDPFSIFDVSDISITDSNSDVPLHKILQSSLDIHNIDSQEKICTKILKGDDKDNVPSSFHWNNKNGNPTRVTDRYVKKIFEKFKEQNLPIHIKSILKNIEIIKDTLEYEINKSNSKKDTYITVPLEELKHNIFLNFKLLYLSRQTFPKDLVSKFDQAFEDLKEGKGLFSKIQPTLVDSSNEELF
jgi:hypothetical protein